jgi:hypothetical protein
MELSARTVKGAAVWWATCSVVLIPTATYEPLIAVAISPAVLLLYCFVAATEETPRRPRPIRQRVSSRQRGVFTVRWE